MILLLLLLLMIIMIIVIMIMMMMMMIIIIIIIMIIRAVHVSSQRFSAAQTEDLLTYFFTQTTIFWRDHLMTGLDTPGLQGPEGAKNVSLFRKHLQLLRPRKDLRTGSISRDFVNFPSELCGRRSCTFMEVARLAPPELWHPCPLSCARARSRLPKTSEAHWERRSRYRESMWAKDRRIC